MYREYIGQEKINENKRNFSKCLILYLDENIEHIYKSWYLGITLLTYKLRL